VKAVMNHRRSPARSCIVTTNDFGTTWPSGVRTWALIVTSLLMSSPENLSGAKAGWPGWVSEDSAGPVCAATAALAEDTALACVVVSARHLSHSSLYFCCAGVNLVAGLFSIHDPLEYRHVGVLIPILRFLNSASSCTAFCWAAISS
jgi:hypothetical protein